MNQNVKQNIQRKIEKKREIEKLSNKSLTIFTVALCCEVILMFLYSALNGSGAYRNAVEDFVAIVSYCTFVFFVILLVSSLVVKAKKGKCKTVSVLRNWGFFTLAVSIAAFLMVSRVMIPQIFSFFGLANLGGVITVKTVRFSGAFAATAIMIATAIYVILAFVYYDMKVRKVKKSK